MAASAAGTDCSRITIVPDWRSVGGKVARGIETRLRERGLWLSRVFRRERERLTCRMLGSWHPLPKWGRQWSAAFVLFFALLVIMMSYSELLFSLFRSFFGGFYILLILLLWYWNSLYYCCRPCPAIQMDPITRMTHAYMTRREIMT